MYKGTWSQKHNANSSLRLHFAFRVELCCYKSRIRFQENSISSIAAIRLRYVHSSFKPCFFILLALQPIVGLYFTALYRALASSRTRFLDHTQRRATFGRNPLKERSVRHRDLYLTTHNTHNRQTSVPRLGYEPTIAAGERP